MARQRPGTMRRVISLRDGTVSKPARGLVLDEIDKWNEADLESALALAPDLLDLGEASPVTLRGGGGGPVQSPDQIYVDSMQRLHVIEIKKGEARLDAIAQVLAYGDMYRMLPRAEIEEARAYMLETRQPEALLDELRAWAKSKSKGRAVSRAFAPIAEAGFPPGLSARHIVVAKSFSEEAKRFAEELTRRGTSLELLQATMRCGGDAVEVEITPIVRESWIGATWNTFRQVWSSHKVRKEMEFVGWAESISKKSFSLALQKDRRVRLMIDVDEQGAWLDTRIPEKYFGGKRTPRGFWEPLPIPDVTNGADKFWCLKELTDQGVADLAGRIAESLAKIFPPAPERAL